MDEYHSKLKGTQRGQFVLNKEALPSISEEPEESEEEHVSAIDTSSLVDSDAVDNDGIISNLTVPCTANHIAQSAI